jgi:hypothetical protein
VKERPVTVNVAELTAQIAEQKARIAELQHALNLLYAECCDAGHDHDFHFGWRKAIRATRNALAATEPEAGP